MCYACIAFQVRVHEHRLYVMDHTTATVSAGSFAVSGLTLQHLSWISEKSCVFKTLLNVILKFPICTLLIVSALKTSAVVDPLCLSLVDPFTKPWCKVRLLTP